MSTILALSGCKSQPEVNLEEFELEEMFIEDEINIAEEDSQLSNSAKHLIALSYYVPLTPENKLDSNNTEKAPFDFLKGGLEEHINKIYLIRKKDFYHEKSWMAAHAHSELGIICLPLDYTKSLVFHEAAHVRHAYVDFLSDFSDEWREVALIGYGSLADITNEDVSWKDGTDGPRHGCLTAYGSTTINEDVAVFVSVLGYEETPTQIKGFLTYGEDIEDFVRIYPFYFCDKNNQKYQKKLDLLHKYNFLTAQEHAKLSENLGCLRHLWVENRQE